MRDEAIDDDALMAAYAAGDTGAFDRLYARHEAGLYRFVRRLLGRAGQAQADEVFQDTWLRVVQSRARYLPQGATFRTWLYTLAQHRVIDVLRQSGREVGGADETPEPLPEPGREPWLEWPAPAAATADERLFWRRAGERLLACLEHLPLAQRAVFLLHHDDGEPLDAIARALDTGFETVKSRLRYAMARLRGCMGAYAAPGSS